jgi:hypothetical protein
MSHPMIKLAVLTSKWAAPLAVAAQLRGHQTLLVDPHAPSCPDPTALATTGWVLFARIDQAVPEEGRAWALRFMSAGGKCVQSMEDIRCYENRAYQMRLLADYYPRGVVLHSPTKGAVDLAIQDLGLPIVSKARFGSSSTTVRLLHSREDVDVEVAEVFGQGKKFPGRIASGKLQYAECLWQAMVHNNEYALRVCRITRQWGWAFKVMNRPHDWRASGSGLCVPVTQEELDGKVKYAVNTFLRMADEVLRSNWCAADLLYDHIAGCWLVVDVTLAWNLSRNLVGANYDAPVINLQTREPHPRGLRGRDQWDILLDDLEAGR